jgi:hypothetical protein
VLRVYQVCQTGAKKFAVVIFREFSCHFIQFEFPREKLFSESEIEEYFMSNAGDGDTTQQLEQLECPF